MQGIEEGCNEADEFWTGAVVALYGGDRAKNRGNEAMAASCRRRGGAGGDEENIGVGLIFVLPFRPLPHPLLALHGTSRCRVAAADLLVRSCGRGGGGAHSHTRACSHARVVAAGLLARPCGRGGGSLVRLQ
jgi:hypothetical protein